MHIGQIRSSGPPGAQAGILRTVRCQRYCQTLKLYYALCTEQHQFSRGSDHCEAIKGVVGATQDDFSRYYTQCICRYKPFDEECFLSSVPAAVKQHESPAAWLHGRITKRRTTGRKWTNWCSPIHQLIHALWGHKLHFLRQTSSISKMGKIIRKKSQK